MVHFELEFGLGDIGKFDLALITRCKLNPKQDFTTLNSSKIFDEDEFYEEETEVEEAEDLTKLLLAKVAKNQVEIIKLKTPLWISTFLLGALVLSAWF